MKLLGKIVREIAFRIFISFCFLLFPNWSFGQVENNVMHSEKVQELVRLATIEAENRITESYEQVIQRMTQQKSDYYISHK